MHKLAFLNIPLPFRLRKCVQVIEKYHLQMLDAYDAHVLGKYDSGEEARLLAGGEGLKLEERVNSMVFEEEADSEQAARAFMGSPLRELRAAQYAARKLFLDCRALYKNARETDVGSAGIVQAARAEVSAYKFLSEIIHQALKMRARQGQDA
jgi:hypothetical protein